MSALDFVSKNAPNLVSEGINLGSDYIRSRIAVNQAKELYDYQTDYKKLYQKMVAAGINPAAAVQGLSGATPSMVSPSVPGSGSMPPAVQTAMEVDRNPSIIAKNNADATKSENEAQESTTRSWLNVQNLFWNPKRWQKELDLAQSQISLNKENEGYFRELKNSLVIKRPYEIQNLQAGLQVAYATVQELNARSKLHGAQSKFYKWSSFRPYWESIGLRHGWDITQPFWRNLGNLAFTNPNRCLSLLQMSGKYLNHIDEIAKQRFGENYKRNVRNFLLLRYANDRLGEHNTKRSIRMNNKTGAFKNIISSFIPFMGGSSVPINPYGSNSSFSFGQNIGSPINAGLQDVQRFLFHNDIGGDPYVWPNGALRDFDRSGFYYGTY